MFGKFRPPLLKHRAGLNLSSNPKHEENVHPSKRRKLSTHADIVAGREQVKPFQRDNREPLAGIPVPNDSRDQSDVSSLGRERFYRVLWRKHTAKKHKTWDGDGVLRTSGGYAYLRDDSGGEMGRTTHDGPLLPGSHLSVGGKEVEIDTMMSSHEVSAIRPRCDLDMVTKTVRSEASPSEAQTCPGRPRKNATISKDADTVNDTIPRSGPTNLTSFKSPLVQKPGTLRHDLTQPVPRHDPSSENALVMKRISSIAGRKKLVDVVVDPILTKYLRPHQREGVKFLYECVMGSRLSDSFGALLADDMGLGKTLQIITLIWTLLKQNPLHGEPPVIRKALIICPVTLISNWRKEFRKWLGLDRLGVFVFDGGKQRVTDFTRGKAYNVMIVGYERLRSISEDLQKSDCIDLIVADEGHRLKTAKNKSAQAIKSLNIPRRVILSGTPIQNDLSEFYIMIDFINPDVLGNFKEFARKYESPIMNSRQPNASAKDIGKGEMQAEALASLTNTFILRRTADILAKYLPPKSEYILMCRPTKSQSDLYRHILSTPVFQSALGNTETSLQLITILKKLCNSPWLLNSRFKEEHAQAETSAVDSLLSQVPASLTRTNQASAKLRILDRLLHTLKATTDEKVVLVSNYTSTLDLLESLLTSLGHPHLRLDGSTPTKKRQEIVDNFNRSSSSTYFAFLLSAKAGGLGINLIGASRLVLFDIDWNPATDLQAMARIHRDGQKKPCVIYRLLLAGGIDEKIWQRQVTKLGLASNVMDQRSGSNSFSREELRDLFRLDEGPGCQTHEYMGCSCRGLGSAFVEGDSPVTDADLPDVPELIQANRLDMEAQEEKIRRSKASKRDSAQIDSLKAYAHIDTSHFASLEGHDAESLIGDDVLLQTISDEDNRVSFVFAKDQAYS